MRSGFFTEVVMNARFLEKTKSGIGVYELENDNGMRAQFINYGARIHRLFAPDKNGDPTDVVAGFDDPDGYRNDRGTYFNAVIGRVGNRIGGAAFELDGKTYKLFANDGKNHLHGGREGFDKKLWDVELSSESCIAFSYLSKDGEEGYPGNLRVKVIYELTNDNELKITYEAASDADTLCSLTNHAYFNLDGDFESALGHEVFINAQYLTAVDEELIPTGELIDIKDTPFDFSQGKTIGRDINVDESLLKIARGGYDFNYVLRGGDGAAATAYSPRSGIFMSVFTDRPCMQFYTGNFLDGFVGKTAYPYQCAFCMETQGYPNACNIAGFPSIELKAHDLYRTQTTYAFDIK